MQANPRASVAAAAVLVVTVAASVVSRADVPLAPAAGVREHPRQELPEGPGKEAVERLCAGCHDLMFTVSTRETEAEWTRIVNDMRSRGMDGTEEEFLQVISYLTRHMGKAEREAHAVLELITNRTKVAPGEAFAVGLRLVAADGWRLKDGVASGRGPHVSWTMPPAVSIGDPARAAAGDPAPLRVFPAVVSTDANPESTLHLAAQVAYEVCRETCVTETATASTTLPVGEGGLPIHEEAFARANAAAPR
jgi:hypothetical protein